MTASIYRAAILPLKPLDTACFLFCLFSFNDLYKKIKHFQTADRVFSAQNANITPHESHPIIFLDPSWGVFSLHFHLNQSRWLCRTDFHPTSHSNIDGNGCRARYPFLPAPSGCMRHISPPDVGVFHRRPLVYRAPNIH